jgi:hypothetical protein
LYSSWPLDTNKDLHKKHKGRLMVTTGAGVDTLDHAVEKIGLKKIDFIKLDVDGHEYSVISGGITTLKRYKPVILMELAPYLFKDNLESFDEMIRVFHDLNYSLYDASTGNIMPNDAARLLRLVPDGASRNVLIKTDNLHEPSQGSISRHGFSLVALASLTDIRREVRRQFGIQAKTTGCKMG